MSEMSAILKQSELFGVLSEDEICAHLIPLGNIQHIHKKQQIIIPQQHMDTFSIVLSGKFHVMHYFPDGSSSLLSVLTAGDALGAELIYHHDRLSPYYTVAVSAAKILSFPVEMLTVSGFIDEKICGRIREQLLMLLSRWNVQKQYRLAILSQKGLRERIMMYLSMLSSQQQSTTLEIMLNREEMAAILCVNRSCLSHELSLMERDGLISFQKNQFTLNALENWTHVFCTAS